MEQMKCPGQDTRFWKPDDIFVAECPKCGAEIEFFKDDARRRCAWCGHMFYNPKIELGCAEWCQYAEKCVPDLVRAKKAAQNFKELSPSRVQILPAGDPAAWDATAAAAIRPGPAQGRRGRPQGGDGRGQHAPPGGARGGRSLSQERRFPGLGRRRSGPLPGYVAGVRRVRLKRGAVGGQNSLH